MRGAEELGYVEIMVAVSIKRFDVLYPFTHWTKFARIKLVLLK
jgi:hypothetical protein